MNADYFRQRSTVDSSGCWIWNLCLDVRGYGRLTFGRRSGYLAHRAAYETLVAPIPSGMTLDHLCYQPACVNPEHLRVATRSENSGRRRNVMSTHCAKGHVFSQENTYIRPESARGKRSCRKCNAQAVARYRARRRAA